MTGKRLLSSKTSLFILCATGLTAGFPADVARATTVSADGHVDFEVNFETPPTPAEVALIKSELQIASDILCDATDGEMTLGTIRMSAGFSAEDTSEIMLLRSQKRSYANGGKT